MEVSAGCLWRSVTADDIRLSARDAAVVYMKLFQLHLTGEKHTTYLENLDNNSNTRLMALCPGLPG